MFTCKQIDECSPVAIRPNRVFFLKLKKESECYKVVRKYLDERNALIDELIDFKYLKLYPSMNNPYLRILSDIYKVFINIPNLRNNINGNAKRIIFQERFLVNFLDDVREFSSPYGQYSGDDYGMSRESVLNIINKINLVILSLNPEITEIEKIPKNIFSSFLSKLKSVAISNNLIYDKDEEYVKGSMDKIVLCSGVVESKIHKPRDNTAYQYCMSNSIMHVDEMDSIFTSKSSAGGKILFGMKRSPLNIEYFDIVKKYKDMESYENLSNRVISELFLFDEELIPVGGNDRAYISLASNIIIAPHITFNAKTRDIYLTIVTTGCTVWTELISGRFMNSERIIKNIDLLYNTKKSGKNILFSSSTLELEKKIGFNLVRLNTNTFEPISIFDNNLLDTATNLAIENMSTRAYIAAADAKTIEKDLFKFEEINSNIDDIKDYGIPIPYDDDMFRNLGRGQHMFLKDKALERIQILTIGLFSKKIREGSTYNMSGSGRNLISTDQDSRLLFRYELWNSLFRSKIYSMKDREGMQGIVNEPQKHITKMISEEYYYTNDILILNKPLAALLSWENCISLYKIFA